LFLGCDREMVMFAGLIAGTLVFYSWDARAAAAGTVLWFVSVYLLRLMAKHDPKLRGVYMRHRLYKPYYPHLSTPWRDNTDSQGKQYRDPWRIA
jgi:type IV secretion system protein VirB3